MPQDKGSRDCYRDGLHNRGSWLGSLSEAVVSTHDAGALSPRDTESGREDECQGQPGRCKHGWNP